MGCLRVGGTRRWSCRRLRMTADYRRPGTSARRQGGVTGGSGDVADGCGGGSPGRRRTGAPPRSTGHGCAPPAVPTTLSPAGVDGSALPRPVADNGPLGVRVIFSPMTSPSAPHDSPAEPPATGSASVIHGGNREHTPHVPSGPEHGLSLIHI